MTIEIEQGDWERIEKPDPPEDIVSGGLGPCVSIFIYDAESKVTYACHYASPDIHQSDEVKNMIDKAHAEFLESKKIQIYVSGAVESQSGSHNKRFFVETLIKNTFHSNAELNFLWPADGIEMTELIFDPDTGILHEPKT